MANLGRRNHLNIVRQTPAGIYLDAGAFGEALLPSSQISSPIEDDQDSLDVFLYKDSDDSIIASLRFPDAQEGDVALLQVSAINNTGAFLRWGLNKELLLPHGEQVGTIQPGSKVLVKLYLDQRGRLVSSMKLDRHLEEKLPRKQFKPGEQLSVIAVQHTDLGVKCAVANRFWGLIYKDELKSIPALERGQQIDAYVRRIRPDGRLDISLKPPAAEQASALTDQIIAQLQANDGFLALGDKTKPEVIFRLFKVSKKVFKSALSQLYRERRIVITDKGIQLSEKHS
ncbi:GntR family transcriptional regulator [Spongiibacter sp. KMU-158]|uniref:GntR family transcriptional regulator n=1 Tax=Spongiibacter pelagi TaxID=2760804 RepID=A0A927C2H9_9GAMM|nr:S1-like domain-containing RNA-binding protein [Spongiibacter pelagi]MBD2858968.1 GntR family transcriptional regulator [Spongiibacter pelagi]